MKNLELDLEKIHLISQQKEQENFRFRSFLKGQDSKRIDSIVHRLNKEIGDQIDCTTCGNCCSILTTNVTKKEIDVLAEYENISPQDFEANFLKKVQYEPTLCLKDMPCRYLKDKKCTIYSFRPDDCRSYPNLHKKDFNSRTLFVLEQYGICPIVFNVFERLKLEFRFR